MDRPFLDANVLFSVAYHPTATLADLWKLANVELLTSNYALHEARDALARKQPAALPNLPPFTAPLTIVPDAPPQAILPAGIVLPQKDAPILLAAIAAQATHLLTGDARHFGPYFGQTVGGVLIMRPIEYLQLYSGGTMP